MRAITLQCKPWRSYDAARPALTAALVGKAAPQLEEHMKGTRFLARLRNLVPRAAVVVALASTCPLPHSARRRPQPAPLTALTGTPLLKPRSQGS